MDGFVFVGLKLNCKINITTGLILEAHPALLMVFPRLPYFHNFADINNTKGYERFSNFVLVPSFHLQLPAKLLIAAIDDEKELFIELNILASLDLH